MRPRQGDTCGERLQWGSVQKKKRRVVSVKTKKNKKKPTAKNVKSYKQKNLKQNTARGEKATPQGRSRGKETKEGWEKLTRQGRWTQGKKNASNGGKKRNAQSGINPQGNRKNT